MTKVEAISNEWAKLIGEENLPYLRIDDNGWSDWHCRKLMPSNYWGALQDKVKYPIKGKQVSGSDLLYRPKSLKGIDNNNGWNKINTRYDLPSTPGNYLFLVDGREVVQYVDEDISFSKSHTHWRNIEIISNPFY